MSVTLAISLMVTAVLIFVSGFILGWCAGDEYRLDKAENEAENSQTPNKC